MDKNDLLAWQKQTHKRGSLLSTWDYMNERETICLVIADHSEFINPFGRKNKIRKVTVMFAGQIYKMSPYEIFPIGEAREIIIF